MIISRESGQLCEVPPTEPQLQLPQGQQQFPELVPPTAPPPPPHTPLLVPPTVPLSTQLQL